MAGGLDFWLNLQWGCRAGSTDIAWEGTTARKSRIVHFDIDPMVVRCRASRRVSAVVAICGGALDALKRGTGPDGAGDGVWRGRHGPPTSGGASSKRFDADRASRTRTRYGQSAGTRHPEAMPSGGRDDRVGPPGTLLSPIFRHTTRFPGPAGISFTNRAHGALGYSLSAALGRMVRRGRTAKTVALMGDGSFGFTCGELETVTATYARRSPTSCCRIQASGGSRPASATTATPRYYNVDFQRSDQPPAAVAAGFGVKSWSVGRSAQAGRRPARGHRPTTVRR